MMVGIWQLCDKHACFVADYMAELESINGPILYGSRHVMRQKMPSHRFTVFIKKYYPIIFKMIIISKKNY